MKKKHYKKIDFNQKIGHSGLQKKTEQKDTKMMRLKCLILDSLKSKKLDFWSRALRLNLHH